jgi:U3 small nucleolar ribonucleoprotein protein IMP3
MSCLDIHVSSIPPTEPADTGTKPSDVENKVTVSAFARRRLAVVIVRLKMAESVSDVSLVVVWGSFGV